MDVDYVACFLVDGCQSTTGDGYFDTGPADACAAGVAGPDGLLGRRSAPSAHTLRLLRGRKGSVTGPIRGSAYQEELRVVHCWSSQRAVLAVRNYNLIRGTNFKKHNSMSLTRFRLTLPSVLRCFSKSRSGPAMVRTIFCPA